MANPKKILIIAGEASGDLHASNLVLEIRKILPDVDFVGVGGSKMRQVGVELIFDNQEIAVTGFSEALIKAPSILKAYGSVKKTLQSLRPDLVILLDFPDFNLRVGKAARKLGIPVVYYISPQVWAWRRGRIRQIRGMVEKILVILPFEASLFGDKGVFVGHPLLDVVKTSLSPEQTMERLGIRKDAPLVALLPGSRRNEVRQLLPIFVEAAHLLQERIPDVQYVIPVAPTIPEEEIKRYIRGASVPMHLVEEETYDALSVADFAVVASGTATLETAILGVPMLIVYKMSAFTFQLAKRLIKVPHIGLVNMVAGERIVPELIQDAVTPGRIVEEALGFLQDRDRSKAVSARLKEAVCRLGEPGASGRAARTIVQTLEKSI